MNIISCDAGEQFLFEVDRDEYIVNLTNDTIDRMMKETNIKELNIDDNLLLNILFSTSDVIVDKQNFFFFLITEDIFFN